MWRGGNGAPDDSAAGAALQQGNGRFQARTPTVIPTPGGQDGTRGSESALNSGEGSWRIWEWVPFAAGNGVESALPDRALWPGNSRPHHHGRDARRGGPGGGWGARYWRWRPHGAGSTRRIRARVQAAREKLKSSEKICQQSGSMMLY